MCSYVTWHPSQTTLDKHRTSDVTIIKIEIKITIFFSENRTESISQFFGTSVTRFRYCIALEEPAISAGGHRMGFTPP